MKYAVIDTEGNGLFDFKKPADDPSQPRLASLGVVLLDDKLETIGEMELLVKPDGWKMTPDSTRVNGLTDEHLAANGQPIGAVLDVYAALIEQGYAIAAYGAQHDCKTMRGEFRRLGRDDLFEKTVNVCLMRALQPLKIPKASGKGGWPKLEDACRFFGIEVETEGAHSALGGAQRAAKVLVALAKRGALPEPIVHRAKNEPAKLQ